MTTYKRACRKRLEAYWPWLRLAEEVSNTVTHPRRNMNAHSYYTIKSACIILQNSI